MSELYQKDQNLSTLNEKKSKVIDLYEKSQNISTFSINFEIF